MMLREICDAIYFDGGQSAVLAYVSEAHPATPWANCGPCESWSPVDDGACLVCGSMVVTP